MHLYALELETQRVWDYAGDGYVHRLIQNKADGKLVELPSASTMTTSTPTPDDGRNLGPSPSDALTAEKIEAIGIEYSYLLTSQLDSQRAFFEEEKRAWTRSLQAERDIQTDLRAQLEAMERDKVRSEERLTRNTEMAKKFETQLRQERALSDGMRRNMESMKSKIDAAESDRKELQAKVTDLEEQLRDVMFFLQARDKIEQSTGEQPLNEAIGGDLVVPPPPASSSRRRRNK